MKQIIKVRAITECCMPQVFKIGEWIDLRAAKDCVIGEGGYYLIPLGVAMQLPEGYEAIVAPRSSTFKNYHIQMTNSFGIIDNSYCGNDDEWKFPALAHRLTTIYKGQRIAQFRIQLSQKATAWQKLKWMFTDEIELVQVERLESENRGGIGSTGIL